MAYLFKCIGSSESDPGRLLYPTRSFGSTSISSVSLSGEETQIVGIAGIHNGSSSVSGYRISNANMNFADIKCSNNNGYDRANVSIAICRGVSSQYINISSGMAAVGFVFDAKNPFVVLYRSMQNAGNGTVTLSYNDTLRSNKNRTYVVLASSDISRSISITSEDSQGETTSTISMSAGGGSMASVGAYRVCKAGNPTTIKCTSVGNGNSESYPRYCGLLVGYFED